MNSELMPIKELAAQLGLRTQTIRQWECKYELIKAVRSEAGHRLYDANQIERMKQIKTLLDAGLSIEQIRTHISHQ
ncbi:MAG TPA: MerR family transcriptional regulator [Pseudomonadales bacterium]|nr:MerR family transcriptional regulator [Pseudomonadales bacterium]